MNKSIAVVTALLLGVVACGDAGTADGTADGAATDTLAARANAVAAVDIATFTADPDGYVGQEVRLERVPLDSHIGTRGIWLKLPNQGLYLVRTAGAATDSVQRGTRITVAGPIREMSDSVVTAWIGDGSITADEEMEARYATSWMDAWYVSSGQRAAAGAAQE